MGVYYSAVQVDPVCMDLSGGVHLGRFHFLVVIGNAAMNISRADFCLNLSFLLRA